MPVILGLCCALALLAVAVVAIAAGRSPGLPRAVYAVCLAVSMVGGGAALAQLPGGAAGGPAVVPAAGPAGARRPLPPRRPGRLLPAGRQPGGRPRLPLRARLRGGRAGAGAHPDLLPRLPGGREPGPDRPRRLHLPALLGVHVARLLGSRAKGARAGGGAQRR